MSKKKISILSIALLLFAYAPSFSLAQTFSDCPVLSGGVKCDSTNGYKFVGGNINSCALSSAVNTTPPANSGKTWQCDTNSFICVTSTNIDCSGTCKAPFTACPAGQFVINQCGSDVASACGCPAGYVYSGRTTGTCVTFVARFGELLTDGLSKLGGSASNGFFDFSTDANVTLKVDSAATADTSATVSDNAITSAKIAADAVTTAKILNGNVTFPKLAACADSQILKYTTATGWVCVAAYTAGLNGGLALTGTAFSLAPEATCNTGEVIRKTATGWECSDAYNAPVFVGLSGSQTSANVGGYTTATARCNSASGLSGSHVCTSDEIIHSYNISSSTILNQTGTIAWFNSGPPGYNLTMVNDCGGWQKNDVNTYGSVWNFAGGSKDAATILTCNTQNIPFACCK